MSNNRSEPQEPNPFDDSEHAEVLASRDIIERGARIAVVVHHEDGRWGFYSESAARDFRTAVRVIFDQLIEEDPDIFRMGHLKKGKMAIRMGTGMNERWIYPGEEKAKKPRGGCLGVLLFSVLSPAILVGVWRLFSC